VRKTLATVALTAALTGGSVAVASTASAEIRPKGSGGTIVKSHPSRARRFTSRNTPSFTFIVLPSRTSSVRTRNARSTAAPSLVNM